MEIQLPLASLRRALVRVVAFLAVASLCADLTEYVLGYTDPYDVVDFFSLSYEANLPTWFSCTLIFGCGVMLALIAFGERGRGGRWAAHWGVLSATFLYISLDELVQLHEDMSDWFDFSGLLYYGWVIPAGLALLVWLVAFVPFIRNLPSRTRNRFLLAGTLYVLGALGVELPLGWWSERHGDDNLGYALIDLVEESLEIGAMGLFLYSLVEHVAAPRRTLRIALGPGVESG